MELQAIRRLILVVASAAACAFAGTSTALWLDVPFVSQPREGCGAAVISMVMQYWARQDGRGPAPSADVARIQSVLYSREGAGIPASAMEKYFEENGFRAFAFRSEWSDLEHHVGLGRPLIVSLAPRERKGLLHYVVVAGLDTQRGFIFLNDPARGKLLRFSREAFENEWKAAGNWTLLAIPWPGD